MAKPQFKVPESAATIPASFLTPYHFLPATAMARLFRAPVTIGISRKSMVKIEPESREVKNKINSAWVDSMRSSSPTRGMPAGPISQNIFRPSAINVFGEIANKSMGKNIVLFLDYDGTLSPIVQDPERAFMTTQMRDAVKDAAKYFPTAIVSGRSRDKVYNFVKLSELYYAGSHGMDIKGPSNSHNKDTKKGNKQVLFQPASEFLPMIDEVYKALVRQTKPIAGAKVESNKFCLSVHYRCVDEKMWGILAEQVRSVLTEYPQLKLTQGRKVLEIRPTIKWDKGKAIEFLLESLGFANSNDVFPIYIGDDRTDEDAFKVLRDRRLGTGILVTKSPKETYASYSVQDPTEVMNFLRRLVEWKKGIHTYVETRTCTSRKQ